MFTQPDSAIELPSGSSTLFIHPVLACQVESVARFTDTLSPASVRSVLYRDQALRLLSRLRAASTGMAGEGNKMEAEAKEGNNQALDPEVKSTKKAPTGARARSIKTPLQKEALEAAYLSKSRRLFSSIKQTQWPSLFRLLCLELQLSFHVAVNQFPAEEVRKALGDRIQLTENQVQVSPLRVASQPLPCCMHMP